MASGRNSARAVVAIGSKLCGSFKAGQRTYVWIPNLSSAQYFAIVLVLVHGTSWSLSNSVSFIYLMPEMFVLASYLFVRQVA